MSATPVLIAKPVVKVTAPADLPGGYEFVSEHDGVSYNIVVPPGGVKMGYEFEYAVDSTPSGLHPIGNRGKWRDDLCNCFDLGCCHALLWTAMCFQFVALGQVMTRMGLNPMAKPGTPEETSGIFSKMVAITIIVFVFKTSYNNAYPIQIDDDGNLIQPTGLIPFLYNLFSFAVFVYFIVAVMRTRKFIRNKYEIPEESCKGCEDLACASCCSCCVIMQMARHTTDYEVHDAACCTPNGIV